MQCLSSDGYLELCVFKNASKNSLKLRLPSRNRKRNPETGQCIRETSPPHLFLIRKQLLGGTAEGDAEFLAHVGTKEHHGWSLAPERQKVNSSSLGSSWEPLACGIEAPPRTF